MKLQHCLRPIGLVLAIAAMVMGLVVCFWYWADIPIHNLTRDPNTIGDLPAAFGFLSQLGLFLWSASATVCFFAASVLWGVDEQRKIRGFLLTSGLLSLLLGIDDAFMFHETVFPNLGVPQNLVLIAYVGLVGLYLLAFCPLIVKTAYATLVMSLFFFGLSMGLDIVHPPGLNAYFFEDGAKLTGLLSWLAYFIGVARQGVGASRAHRASLCSDRAG